jgi:hypothetical protein
MCNIRPAYRSDRPTDPDAMLRHLRAEAGSWEAFPNARDLLVGDYLSPPQMAALFEALSRLPGTTVIRDVPDGAGRAAIRVALAHDHVRIDIVLEPGTYAYRGVQVLVGTRTVSSYTVLAVAIVDRVGQTV